MSRRRGRRLRRLTAALVAGSLVIVLGCLIAVGSPPVVGVDALWDKAHAPEVRLMLGAEPAATRGRGREREASASSDDARVLLAPVAVTKQPLVELAGR